MQLVDKFSENDIYLISQYLTEESIAKNEHFLNFGEIRRHVAFIGTGLAMHYRLHDGMVYLSRGLAESLTVQADLNQIKIISSPTKTKY